MSVEARIKRLYELKERTAVELFAVENGTLPFLEERRNVTPAELADELGISRPGANNRLKELVRWGLATREQIPVEGGGKAFSYSPSEPSEEKSNG